MRLLLFLPLLLLWSCRTAIDSPVVRHKPGADSSRPAPPPELEILTYGLADYNAGARHRVARKYGFSYRQIAGCVVTDSLVRHANAWNSAVGEELLKMHGSGWEERFEQEVTEAAHLDAAIRKLAFANPVIAARQVQLDNEGKGMLFAPASTDTSGMQDVIAYTYGIWQGKPAYVTAYDLRVNIRTAQLLIVANEHRFYQSIEPYTE